jgi:hypothetical protein
VLAGIRRQLPDHLEAGNMSATRVIVTQQSKTDMHELTHKGYDVDNLGLGILGGLQIVSDPGYEIAAVYIVESK